MMKLAVRPFTVACSALWGVAVLLCALCNWWWPPYAEHFLQMLSSVYPGYTAEASFGSVVNVTLYALVDGAIGGLVLSSLYNLLLTRCCRTGNGE